MIKQEKKLIKEAVKIAGQILAMTFSLLDLKNHIEGNLDFGEFGKFELKFTKLKNSKLPIPHVSNNEVAVCECNNPAGTPVNKINDRWICCICNRPLAN